MSFCLPLPLPKKTAPSPTLTGGCSASAKPSTRPGLARPDWQIICDLARRIEAKLRLSTAGWDYAHPSEIWEEMRQLTPDFGGIDYDRLEREGGVHWPCPGFDHPGTPYLFEDEFPSGARQVLRRRVWHRERTARRRLPLHSQHGAGAIPLGTAAR